ncbi:MAG: hypothetical protein M0P95_17840 [Sulfuritalea sp.]|jgi:hypothetical protein|nr:hypothetical protein [Sulfuritalea sp.]
MGYVNPKTDKERADQAQRELFGTGYIVLSRERLLRLMRNQDQGLLSEVLLKAGDR